MGIKDQLIKLKENWLLIAIVLVILFVFMGGSNVLSGISRSLGSTQYYNDGLAEASYAKGGYYYDEGDFAPEVQERQVIKTASMSTEVEKNDYKDAEARLKNIVSATGSYLLTENVNKNGEGWKAYYSGYYQIKVDTSKYDSVVSQLKEIGEVISFNENARDVTGRYTDLKTDLVAEKARLNRYLEMYNKATDINDKINLNDRIFNQERTIKYIEEGIDNIDKRVDYSTITVSMTEERSGYVGIAVVKFSALIKGLVGSFNTLVKLLFILLPWALAGLIILWLVRLVKRN